MMATRLNFADFLKGGSSLKEARLGFMPDKIDRS
jgi:hypothetical protein